MHEPQDISTLQLAREKALYRYSSALERGDFDTVVAVLREAQHDPVLERMLVEVHEEYEREYDATVQADEVALLIFEFLNDPVIGRAGHAGKRPGTGPAAAAC
jgi:repressor of nif and glnA expression